MTRAIVTRQLSKSYGRHRGIEGVDLEVREGEVFGYLGPNGAGKTTTIRLLLDLLRPTSGSVEVLGKQPRDLDLRRAVGYLPGELALYEDMTVRSHLRYLANLRGLRSMELGEALAERFDLDPSRKIANLSAGNKQKVGVVQAFMHYPRLLVLDEPTGGLDPLMQQEFYHLVREVQAEGRTVFLSSHVLSEVERIADRVAIIRDGSIIVVDDLESLKAKAPRRIELHFSGPVSTEEFAGLANVRNVQVDDGVVTCEVVGSVDALIKAAARHEVTNVISHEADLEELFLHYLSGAGDVA